MIVKILAFDTSTAWLSVAVHDGTRRLARDERVENAHSSRLLPLVDHVLGEAGLALTDLDAIAFGAGPGSFTGVRTACSVAQGLGLGAGLPLVPVSTLTVLAQTAWRRYGAPRVVACLDARMREVYAASMQRVGDAWQEVQMPAVVAPDAVVVPSPAGDWFGAGDGFAAYPDLAVRLALGGCDAALHPQAEAIIDIALLRVAAGAVVAAAEAQPVYVRHRVALTTAERHAGARL